MLNALTACGKLAACLIMVYFMVRLIAFAVYKSKAQAKDK